MISSSSFSYIIRSYDKSTYSFIHLFTYNFSAEVSRSHELSPASIGHNSQPASQPAYHLPFLLHSQPSCHPTNLPSSHPTSLSHQHPVTLPDRYPQGQPTNQPKKPHFGPAAANSRESRAETHYADARNKRIQKSEISNRESLRRSLAYKKKGNNPDCIELFQGKKGSRGGQNLTLRCYIFIIVTWVREGQWLLAENCDKNNTLLHGAFQVINDEC